MDNNPNNRRSMDLFNINDYSLANFEFTFEQFSTHDDTATNADVLDSQSISESITAYREENGRTYHAYRDGWYYLPNDSAEISRLMLQYETLHRAMGNKTHFAPWTQDHYPHRVLDLGTGTGDWVMDFGDEYPQTEYIVGTDLSPIQPDRCPPNVRFFVEDAAGDWADDDLDYVHTRCTAGCWADMRSQVVQQAFDKLRPGGYLETQEMDPYITSDDGTVTPEHGFFQWVAEMNRVSNLAGRPCHITPDLRQWYADAGFVDVEERVIKVPINGWHPDPEWRIIGQMWQRMILDGISGVCRAYFSRVEGKTIEEIEMSLVNVRNDVRNENYHAYMNFHIIWGRKPGDLEAANRYTLNISEMPERRPDEEDEMTS